MDNGSVFLVMTSEYKARVYCNSLLGPQESVVMVVLVRGFFTLAERFKDISKGNRAV